MKDAGAKKGGKVAGKGMSSPKFLRWGLNASRTCTREKTQDTDKQRPIGGEK